VFGDAALALIAAARQRTCTAPSSQGGFDRALGTAVAILIRETPPVSMRAAITARARLAVLLAGSNAGE
jgi:hypothetical protein